MDWYEEWFGEEYKLVYPHRDEAEAKKQIEFLLQRVDLPEGAKILDLCCGCGRHAVELKERGYDVMGLDLSEELLDMACSRAYECGQEISFIRCDMREIPFEDHFDLIVNFFTSFGYFEDDADNQRVLLAIAKALKPGGEFLIDYMNPEHVAGNVVERDEKEISDEVYVIQERWMDESPRRINKKITLIRGDEKSTFRESVRMYSHGEMRDMLSAAGLKLTETYGDFSGSRYTRNSTRMVLMGRKGTEVSLEDSV
jgi:ubiquinone/menaquinone biosynthesis C-methylase UbiE